MDNDWEKELIRELKSFLACQRAVLSIKVKLENFLQLLAATKSASSKDFYAYHIHSLELKLAQAQELVSRLNTGLSVLTSAESAVLFDLYIKPSGKKKIGSQGQVYRLKDRAMQKLFVEFNGYVR